MIKEFLDHFESLEHAKEFIGLLCEFGEHLENNWQGMSQERDVIIDEVCRHLQALKGVKQ